ncbi:hypothetical protein I9T54_00020 [Campylobacter peloridis]|uniref:hypothetical protein n=1 Tax=Campylobacter peloridis TaxID=488546 RepID=UPI00127ED1CF|nr:hypothetical protein [Campylobacter peloridis]EAK0794222.1 hypothetical protein [Campylobacter lari]EDP6895792.1 hypothetical protein [Campylobacter lari]EIY6495422.1 hypothetical protein [Campylobacter lari]MBX2077926.1 hypothetical protein [Campylobacter peloridis]MCV3342325.1 hypothetical protein [Campylobacter lari]
MTTQQKQEDLDYLYIEKLKTKSERQLKVMLDTLEKEIVKIQAEKTKLDKKFENRLKYRIKKGHFIKDALMEKWRTPSKELLEAMQEVKNGETTTYNSIDEMMKDLQQ